MHLFRERRDLVAYGRKLLANGLTVGTGGNLSVRSQSDLVAISPSGIAYDAMQPRDITIVDLNGTKVEGNRKPSSELPMHLAVYQKRSDLRALVHTHSCYATALSCLRRDLPAIHYALGFAGPFVRCAPYATYGTSELAKKALDYMNGSKAVLLANHGVLAGGATLSEAFMIAQIVEFCAQLYCIARAVGKPQTLSQKEMERVIHKLAAYGQN